MDYRFVAVLFSRIASLCLEWHLAVGIQLALSTDLIIIAFRSLAESVWVDIMNIGVVLQASHDGLLVRIRIAQDISLLCIFDIV